MSNRSCNHRTGAAAGAGPRHHSCRQRHLLPGLYHPRRRRYPKAALDSLKAIDGNKAVLTTSNGDGAVTLDK